MTGGGIVDLSEQREARHKAIPRDGEGYYRLGVLKGYAGTYRPRELDYPLTIACECGRTIKRLTPDVEWEHVQW